MAKSASHFHATALLFGLLLPASTWAVEAPLFTDVTENSGIFFSVTQGAPVTGVGMAVLDLDGDGALDVLLSGGTDLPMTALRNVGDMQFVPIAQAQSGLDGASVDPRGMMVADYDNDGDADLFIADWDSARPSRLLNNAGGFFTDVSDFSEMHVPGDATGGAWGDFDNDGWLDLYVSRYWGMPNLLFRNNQDGTFTDVTEASGMMAPVPDGLGGVYPGAQTFQTLWMDVDRDGDLDLMEINDRCYNGYARNLIWKNLGDGTFVEDGASFGFDLCFDGMGMALADADRDGFLDVYITNVPDGHFFLQGGCDGWTDVSASSGVQAFQWGWGVLFEDFNHDTWPDLYVAHAGYVNFDTANALYINEGNGSFTDVGMLSDAWGGNHDSGVVVQADFDGDGDADILINQLYESPYVLLRNDGPTEHWLSVQLEGVASNRDGLGAWVDVLSGAGWQRRLRHETTTFKGRSDPALRFGLGSAMSVERIVIRWPSGAVQVIQDVAADQRLVVVEEDTGGANSNPHQERCGDGVDNDCDGETDEGFDVGGACVVGTGACAANGVLICDYGQYDTICQGTPALPTDEIGGDGIDNDCDGEVDEVVNPPVCAGTLEICGDQIDNDCDGSTDEGFPPFGMACEAGSGACQSAGIWQCTSNGLEAYCTAVPAGPVPELCGDGIDNDCDGEIDEGFAFGADCTAVSEDCAVSGTMGCGPNGSLACVPGPEASWVELCGDALDNDCDGSVDEGFATGAVCWSGDGACRRKGAMICTVDLLAIECTAEPGEPAEEIGQDGLDNDCDGFTDEAEGLDAGETAGEGETSDEESSETGDGGAWVAAESGGCGAVRGPGTHASAWTWLLLSGLVAWRARRRCSSAQR